MPELTVLEQIDQKLDILDPLKFFEHVKILDATTNQIIKYEMWPHLAYVIRAIYKWPLIIILKPKQVGISWTFAGIARHKCYNTGTNVIEISKGEDQAADLLAKSKFIDSQLPKHLQLEKSHDGIFLVSYKNTHSRIHTVPSTVTAGLGETATFAIGDEHEFHPYAKENWAHLKATIDAGAHGIFGSTADPTSIDSNFKVLWRGAREGMGSCYPIPDVNLVVNEGEIPGPNGFFPIFIGYDCRPGRDEEWYEATKKTYDLEWQFKANYPRTEEEALSPILGRGVFDVAILQNLQLTVLKEIEIRQGVIHIWHRPKVGTQYIAGLDMAEGRGGDYSVLWIEAKEGLTREQVALIHSNNILIDTFAYMSYELLKEYFNPRIIGGMTPYEQSFYENLLALGYDRGKIYCSDDKREKLGYKESGNSREKDILELEKTIRGSYKVNYIPAIKEMFAMQWKDPKSGIGKARAEVAEGSHDDLIIAACRANFGFTQYKVDRQKITVSYPKTWRG